MLRVLTNVPPFLFNWYLLDTLRCNRRNLFSNFFTVFVLLILGIVIPLEQTARFFIPTSIPMDSPAWTLLSACDSHYKMTV